MQWSEVRGLAHASDAAFSLFLQGLSYIAFHETHGVLSHEALAWLYRASGRPFAVHQEAVAELIVRDAWIETGAGVLVDDWEWWLEETLSWGDLGPQECGQ